MDRTAFGKKTLNTHRPRVDRFVAPRDSFPELRRRAAWKTIREQPVDVWNGKCLKQKRYINYIDEALGLESLNWEPPCEPVWPCVPRKKCYLSTADSILDLPTYSSATFPELLDWSNDNILIAALGRNYHEWSWHSQSHIAHGFAKYRILCCKYDPRGELLLLGTVATVELHDNALTKCINENACHCYERELQDCAITAVDWSPTGNSFVTGCSRGKLTSFNRKAQIIIDGVQVINNGTAVLTVRVSPDARFVAASSVDSDGVSVLIWPGLQLYTRVRGLWSVRTLAWHPWRSALLAIGSVTPAPDTCFEVWAAPSNKMQQETRYITPYCLDTMLFNKKTGELVLSLWDSEGVPKASSLLAVLSEPETMVDQYAGGGLDRVRTMVFSPDGTKLATATAEEDLIIWNFLPEDRRKKKVACRRFSSLPVYLDKTNESQIFVNHELATFTAASVASIKSFLVQVVGHDRQESRCAMS